ncbi:DUF4291 domain-containing protein [Streptomyces cylindrosporus]|uniref:DUF4291 domain-containing protein n=1 Tax=Streptomyces cylindrosporus TaxID=2927583 RepID=A0ABS9Y675_9ACTN|nr:DUF4291 domain-containing protein [Streptomyces cylindrosporus]MCI3272715.1 DUF4291 domain-containing protein [Streptomyces cylindrosporus]
MEEPQHRIRAAHSEDTVTVYQAYSPESACSLSCLQTSGESRSSSARRGLLLADELAPIRTG